MSRIRRIALLAMAGAGAVLASGRARAQLVAPEHVRIVRVEGHTPQEGSFVDASADSLRINTAYGLGVISLPIRSIQSIDASTGTRTDAGRVLKGAATGMGIALVATAGITALACATQHGGDGQRAELFRTRWAARSPSSVSSPARGLGPTIVSTTGIASTTVASPRACTSVQPPEDGSRSA
jgi:hypothetical protein